MNLFRNGTLTALGLFLFAAYAPAATIYNATLLPSTEVPPVASPASGFATLTLNGNLLSVDVTFSGLTSPATASHIHCCGAPGTNFAVAVPFPGFPNATSGSYMNTFDLTLTATYNPPFLTSVGGTAAAAEAAIIAALGTGQTYVNIHNANNPGGEIRGFPAAVPEPSTLFLGSVLIAGLGFQRLRVRLKVNRRPER